MGNASMSTELGLLQGSPGWVREVSKAFGHFGYREAQTCIESIAEHKVKVGQLVREGVKVKGAIEPSQLRTDCNLSYGMDGTPVFDPGKGSLLPPGFDRASKMDPLGLQVDPLGLGPPN